jgi:single-strand DNA-binding protein
MARGINKVMIMGNLGVDPEVRYMPSGSAVTNIRVATTEVWKDRQSGERQERTEWHRIVLFNRLGEIAAQYLRKGSRVFIEGSLKTNKWQDANGQDRYTTEIIASSMQLMDAKGEGTGFDAGHSESAQSMPESQDHFDQRQQPKKTSAAASVAMKEEAFDDDIPF